MSSKMERERVDPVHHRIDDSHDYSFGSVAVDEVDLDEIDTDNVTVEREEEGIVWQYGDKPEVLIKEDGVYSDSQNRKEAERQAYFALSILDSKGYVSLFRRKY